MQERSIVARIAVLPLRHKLIGACVSLAVLIGFLLAILLLPPQKYRSSALLSFDGSTVTANSLNASQNGQGPTEALAESILSDETIKTLCWQLNMMPENPTGAEVADFRASLTFTQVSPLQLRVDWRGPDASQAVAATNAVAVLLASWVPEAATSHASVSISPVQPGLGAPKGATPALENVLRQHQLHQFKLAATEQSLAELGEEARKLEEKIKSAGAEKQRALSARQPLVTQLATERKKLEGLRTRYTDEYPDVEASRERIAEIQAKLDALPAQPAAQDADENLLSTVTKQIDDLRAQRALLLHQLQVDMWLEKGLGGRGPKGQAQVASRSQPPPGQGTEGMPLASDAMNGGQARPFTVVESASDAKPMDNRYSLLRRAGALVGPLCGLFYLFLAARWFRAVSNAESLERILPAGVPYLGAIPGMNRWRHNI